MDFADERFIRVYTRDTRTWLRWGWEGQTVFVLTMRKFDQTGRIDVDDPVEDVALLTGLPADVVRVGLPRVLASGTFVHTGRAIECPNFIDGQTASRSDSARCREYRARLKARREIARDVPSQSQPDRESPDTKRVATDTKRVAIDTKRPTATRDPASHPKSSQIIDTSDWPSAGSDPSAPVDAPRSEVAEVFEHWKRVCERPKVKLLAGDKRDRAIKRALKRYSKPDLLKAIDGCARSDFHMARGQYAGQQNHDELASILGDEAKIDAHIARAEGNVPPRALARNGASSFEAERVL